MNKSSGGSSSSSSEGRNVWDNVGFCFFVRGCGAKRLWMVKCLALQYFGRRVGG